MIAGLRCECRAGGVSDVISRAEQLQRLEEHVPGRPGERHEPIQHTGDVVLQQRMQRIERLWRYQLAVLIDRVNGVGPKRNDGEPDVGIIGPEVDRASYRLADGPADITFYEG